ncbi:MAG: ABC transporter substrate-binding protein [Myxococcota bacterium]|nr:ABC transporter substrate-binding protein [Myxococcota bacterium]
MRSTLICVITFLLGGLTTLVSAEERRIVTLGAGVTETVFALGLGQDVVGVDVSSLYPPDAVKKPKVGYVRMTSAEGIASLKPTMILAPTFLGPATVQKQLADAGLNLKLVEAPKSIDMAMKRVRQIGDILGKTSGAERLVAEMQKKIDEAQAHAKGQSPKRILFIFVHGGTAMQVGGLKTAANVMIQAAGATNAVTEYEGYRPLSPEALLIAKPDVILATTRGLKAIGGEAGVWKSPGLALTPAGKSKALIVMDDLKLLGFGPRTGEAILELSRKIYR